MQRAGFKGEKGGVETPISELRRPFRGHGGWEAVIFKWLAFRCTAGRKAAGYGWIKRAQSSVCGCASGVRDPPGCSLMATSWAWVGSWRRRSPWTRPPRKDTSRPLNFGVLDRWTFVYRIPSELR